MKIQCLSRKAMALLVVALFVFLSGFTVCAQSTATQQSDAKEDETNLDTQLFLIVATNQSVADEKLPTVLDPVVKQLRTVLPFKNYRLAATLINRVKNDGRLDLNWIGGPLVAARPESSSPLTPSFSQFKIRSVKLINNSTGQPFVQMLGFNFGARIPIQTGQVAVNGGTPTINYENTGLATDISVREGEPAVVGTLIAGPSGEAIIIVVTAKRTGR